jgi:WD40 repeat protein/serine/threonine protein kinase
MTESRPMLRDLFMHAVGQVPSEEWESFLDMACEGNAELRDQVAGLLKIHQDAGSFLNRPAGPMGTIPQTPAEITAAARPREGAGTVIGPYKLLQQIGEGGMGTVYMAEQTRPVQRKVALKVIKPGMDSQQVVARFEAERQALAMMDHVNIARVFDGGATESGRPYFVMELVHGVPITKFCDDNHLTPRQRLELFVPVCHAIQHAHQKGVIHRDIKPSNILVTVNDGAPTPKVIDFGIAKATQGKLTDATVFTQYGAMVGTLEYMSPEQAEMSALGVDTRSDIYSLGVLLYELLTGSTPLNRKRMHEAAYADILRMIKEEDPPRPSTRLSQSGKALETISARRQMDATKLTRLMRGELDWIVMKCLEKDRGRRYETANAFAADVQRYLADETVLACPPSTWYRLRKFARRNRVAFVAATMTSATVVLAVIGLAVSTVMISNGKRETEKSLQAETKAKDEQKAAAESERVESYYHRIALAHRELSVDNLGRALDLLDHCPNDLRGWEWQYLKRLCSVEPIVIRDEGFEINCLAFSPDGERIISANGNGSLTVWNSRTGGAAQTIEKAHAGYSSCVAFHPDGEHVASIGSDKRMRVWNLKSGRSVFERPCDSVHVQGASHAMAFQPPDGRHLAAGHEGTVNIWDWMNDRLPAVHSFGGHDRLPINLTFSADGQRLASGSWRGTVRLWNLNESDEPYVLPATRDSRHPLSALDFSRDGARLATASFERRVDVWDLEGRLLNRLLHDGLVQCVAFSRDGKRIVSSGEDKTVHLWDASTGREILGLRGHTGACGCVAFSPDGIRVASASKDGTIRIWDASPVGEHERQEMKTLRHHAGEIWSLAVSPDGGRVVSAGFNTPPTLWDTATGDVVRTLPGHRDVVFGVGWDRDGRRIASAGADRGQFTVKVLNAQTGQEEFTLPAEVDGEYFTVAFSPDGRHIVTGRRNGAVELWDAQSGKHLRKIGNRVGTIRGVVFSRDGQHLASIGGDGVVQLWEATRLTEDREPRLEIRARIHGPCVNIAFSVDGKRLATGGKGDTVKIWNVLTGEEELTLRGHNGDIYSVAFSPDPSGRFLASAGEDSSVKVWDTRTGELWRSFRGHTGLVSSVAFRAGLDGWRLITGSRDRSIKIWDVSPLAKLAER